MRADDEGNGEWPVLHIGLVDGAEIGGRDEVDPRLLRPAQHHAADAGVGLPVARVDDEVEARRDVGRTVEAVLQMHRQRGEICIIASQHNLLHGRLRMRQLDDLRRGPQAPLHFRKQRVLRYAEGKRKPRAVCGHVGDELLALGADGSEQHRLRIVLDELRQVCEVERLVMPLHMA